MIAFWFVKMNIGILKAAFQSQLKIMKILSGLWKMVNIVPIL